MGWLFEVIVGIMAAVLVAEVFLRMVPRDWRFLRLGGSNVHGAGLSDHQTWPATVEHQSGS